MKIYNVGGAVRDQLLGLAVTDRDYVVVGSTPAEMIKLGYKPVGRDFPVFLHPQTKDEYALARTERKTARGYHGFEFHAAPEVTLEEDLARRDLTINAIAQDETGNIIDPFDGVADLRAGILRHVGPAFAEDPVRILRVARFAARFGFAIAPATVELMRGMVASGEAAALVAERVWQELARGLMERRPSRMFRTMHECGALAVILPELAAIIASGRVLEVLDDSAARELGLSSRFALLAMHAGEGAIATLCSRLRVPEECRELALLAARQGAGICAASDAPAEQLVELLQATDALRRPARFAQLLEVCVVDAASSTTTAAEKRLRVALAASRAVDAGAIAKDCKDPSQIKTQVTQARVAAVSHALPIDEDPAKRNSKKEQ
jgi:tRNA nucleotidyltransferase (CCA-adding enzyme)